MGRKKPGKPRRQRVPRQYTLQDLNPPGDGYDEWLHVNPNMSGAPFEDPRVSPDGIDLMRRVQRLGPTYNGTVPMAAVLLDMIIDTGHLPLFNGDDEGQLVPLEAMAPTGAGASPDEIRRSIHGLHSVGALLVFHDEEHDVQFVRLVAKRPDAPGGAWQFVGDDDVVTAKTCLPDRMWEELPPDVAMAVAFMRTCRSQLTEPDPEEFGTHEGVDGTKHAKKLFAAALASGFVDEKGCEVCPTGHLCTLKDA